MQTYYDPLTRQWVTRNADGTTRPATLGEALEANRLRPAPPGTPMPASAPLPVPGLDDEGGGGTAGGSQGKRGGGREGVVSDDGGVDATVPPPVSYDPPAGGPTFTPGFVFGQGAIPGQGADYQRQWFDVGPNAGTESLNVEYYNDPSNWNFAWDKVVNQFGGMPGGAFNEWIRDFSSKARADYQNAVPYDPNLDVANFLDAYAPQLSGVFGLLPGSQKGMGGSGRLAGRSTY